MIERKIKINIKHLRKLEYGSTTEFEISKRNLNISLVDFPQEINYHILNTIKEFRKIKLSETIYDVKDIITELDTKETVTYTLVLLGEEVSDLPF